MAFLTILWAVVVLSGWAALIALLSRRMYRPYPALVAYLAANAVSDAVLFGLVGLRSPLYSHFWFGFEACLLGLKVWMVRELARLVFAEYRGIGDFAKRLTSISVCCALGVCLLTVSRELSAAPVLERGYRFAFMAGRWVSTVLAGVTLALSAFFATWGLPGKPNVERYRWITTAWLVGDAALWFWFEVDPRIGVSQLRMALSAACLLAWALCITERGEIERRPGPGLSAPAGSGGTAGRPGGPRLVVLPKWLAGVSLRWRSEPLARGAEIGEARRLTGTAGARQPD